jgi:CHASE3 domain sensor protein
MLWTWVLVSLVSGEILIYLILVASKTLLPYRIEPPIRSHVMFYILCLGLFVMGGIAFLSYNEARNRMGELDILYEQITAIVEVEDTMNSMESSQRAFLITADQSYLDSYDKLKETLGRELEDTKKFYKDTPDQRRVDAFTELVRNEVVFLDKNIEIKKGGKQEDIQKNLLMGEGRNIMNMVTLTAKELQDRGRVGYGQLMSGFRELVSARFYMSFMLMVAALVQVGLTAVLGRSRHPISAYESGSYEMLLPEKKRKNDTPGV